MIPFLFIVLLICMVAVGSERGLTSFFALLMNVVVMIVTLFMITAGINPLAASFICAVALGIITLFYQNGFNEKTVAAFKAVLIITVMMIIAAVFFCLKTELAGLNEISVNEDETLFLDGNIGVNMMMIAVPMIVIGLMGAIIDTAIAVSSAVYEVRRNNPGISDDELFISGIRIGKNIMGTTINTLYFAMAGESMMLFNVMKNQNYSFARLINSSAFAEIFAGIIFSAIACTVTIPVTSYIFSKQKKLQKNDFL